VVNDLLSHLGQPGIQAGFAIQLDAVAKGKADEREIGQFL
jgi:hypothetical protein